MTDHAASKVRDVLRFTWGIKRRCFVCGLYVWETKAGRLCRHMPFARNGKSNDAQLSQGQPASRPRCEGSDS